MKFAVVFASWIGSVLALSCLSDTHSPVDTWLIVKEPYSTNYFYAEPSFMNATLSPSIHSSLNLTDAGALSWTTQQMWNADSYIIYNDENPMNATYDFSAGHTKGYLFWSEGDSEGVWIQHSIPQFPVGPGFATNYPGLTHNAWTNAQQIFCMTLTVDTLDAVAGTMLLNAPRISDSKYISSGGQTDNLAKLVSRSFSVEPICIHPSVSTVSGLPLTVFGKSAQWNQALWDDCVGPLFRKSLLVQSWLQGANLGPSCSSTLLTEDVLSLEFPFGHAWNNSHDHSKWAVSTDATIICVGDINRVISQAQRGGGAVCFTHPMLAKQFLQSIQTVHGCT